MVQFINLLGVLLYHLQARPLQEGGEFSCLMDPMVHIQSLGPWKPMKYHWWWSSIAGLPLMLLEQVSHHQQFLYYPLLHHIKASQT